jgi:fluoroacetyl-CoA thioesterase
MMRAGLLIGEPHVVRYTVPANQTVPDLLPELAEFRRGQPVFATGFMVGLMEAPCIAAICPHLEPGEATVGTLIDMSHLRASLPGTPLVAEARAIEIDGRSVRFAVVVEDSAGDVVAAGVHALRVIDAARFRDRLGAKRAEHRRRGSVPDVHGGEPLASQPPATVVDRGRIAVARAPKGSREKPASITAARAHASHGDRRSAPMHDARGSRRWSTRVVLTDGSATLVRPVRPSDADGLMRFLDGLSSQSVYQRFCSGGVNLRAAVGRFVEIADDRVGLVACDPDGEIVAHAEYLLLANGAAEVAIVVADRLHGRGLGRAMIDLLITNAQTRGIERFVASVLPANAAMLAVFTHAYDATVFETPDECEVSFAIAPSALALREAA